MQNWDGRINDMFSFYPNVPEGANCTKFNQSKWSSNTRKSSKTIISNSFENVDQTECVTTPVTSIMDILFKLVSTNRVSHQLKVFYKYHRFGMRTWDEDMQYFIRVELKFFPQYRAQFFSASSERYDFHSYFEEVIDW